MLRLFRLLAIQCTRTLAIGTCTVSATIIYMDFELLTMSIISHSIAPRANVSYVAVGKLDLVGLSIIIVSMA